MVGQMLHLGQADPDRAHGHRAVGRRQSVVGVGQARIGQTNDVQ